MLGNRVFGTISRLVQADNLRVAQPHLGLVPAAHVDPVDHVRGRPGRRDLDQQVALPGAALSRDRGARHRQWRVGDGTRHQLDPLR